MSISKSESTSSGKNVFPVTQITWIDHQLQDKQNGWRQVNEHVMAVYAHPLKVYYLGSSYRTMGDADDILNGFFASRLSREHFFHDWQQSDKPLRRWLMNAMIFYLKETLRKNRAHGMEEINPSDHPDNGHALTERVDAAWTRSIVSDAYTRATEACSKADQDDHWSIFHRHAVLKQEYSEIAPDFGVTAAQATVMSRTAKNKFRRALRESLERDGVHPSEVDQEIKRMLDTL